MPSNEAKTKDSHECREKDNELIDSDYRLEAIAIFRTVGIHAIKRHVLIIVSHDLASVNETLEHYFSSFFFSYFTLELQKRIWHLNELLTFHHILRSWLYVYHEWHVAYDGFGFGFASLCKFVNGQ